MRTAMLDLVWFWVLYEAWLILKFDPPKDIHLGFTGILVVAIGLELFVLSWLPLRTLAKKMDKEPPHAQH